MPKTCIKCSALFVGRRCLECKKISDKKWREANKERRIAVDLLWVKNNPDKVKATKARWVEKNPDKRKAANAKWQSAHPEVMRVHDQNRRARKLKSEKRLSAGLFDKLFRLQKGKCACCHADLKKKKPHMDHAMPLALGGLNIDENMQLLCQFCNQSKNAKHPIDFMQSRGFLL